MTLNGFHCSLEKTDTIVFHFNKHFCDISYVLNRSQSRHLGRSKTSWCHTPWRIQLRSESCQAKERQNRRGSIKPHKGILKPSSSTLKSTFFSLKQPMFFFPEYSARRLMGSGIIESAAYCNQISLTQVYINIRLMLSLSCWPKVILLSGGHCIRLSCNVAF